MFAASASWISKALLAAAALAAAAPAAAIDTSYYVYNGFDEAVSAFTFIGLIFADPRYRTMVVIVATIGIAFGSMMAMVRGGGMDIARFMFQILVGAGLFIGLITPTGTVNIYDRVRNAYQPVGGVPDLVIIVAGMTNLFERGLTEVIDDNTPDVTAKSEFSAYGHPFDLFLNAVSPRVPMVDTFLDASIKDYVKQCYPVARVSPPYGVTDDILFRTATDLQADAFAKMAGPATFSTVYTSADPAGTTVSCSDAWAEIQPRLNDPSAFDTYKLQLCAQTGFNMADAAQKARCSAQLAELGGMMTGVPKTTNKLLADIALSRSVGDVLFEDSPASAQRTMANRAVISGGLASLSAANEWLPTVHAVVLAITLGTVPMLCLFLLTPLFGSVARFGLGMFAFLALWGIFDAMIHQLTLARALDVMAELKTQGAAVNAYLLAPSAAMKSLAIFGTFRTASASIAAAFAFTVFRLSGLAFANLVSTANADIGAGASASSPLLTNEGLAGAISTQAGAGNTLRQAGASGGFDGFRQDSGFASNKSFAEGASMRGAGDGYGINPGYNNGLGMGAFAGQTSAAREKGGLDPLFSKGASPAQVESRIRDQATTSTVEQFAAGDETRRLAGMYFPSSSAIESQQIFGKMVQGAVQGEAFGNSASFARMQNDVADHFRRKGYTGEGEAEMKAKNVIGDFKRSPQFGEMKSYAMDEQARLKDSVTSADVARGAAAGTRDAFGGAVARTVESNTATQLRGFTGDMAAMRGAAADLGMGVGQMREVASRVGQLDGFERAAAVGEIAQATGRSNAEVLQAVQRFQTASNVGTADGQTAEAAREGTTIYGRTSEAGGFDFAERGGKLDAQREIGKDGVRSVARTGEQRRQADNTGFVAGAAAAGLGVREAANLDAFMGSLTRAVGNTTEVATGGTPAIADRAANSAELRIARNEQMSRVQGVLQAAGAPATKRQLAMDQNGDVTVAGDGRMMMQLHRGGIISDGQYGAVADGGVVRFSMARNDALVSSTATATRNSVNDSSDKAEAGKQMGTDTAQAFLTGGAAGHHRMENFLRGGFEMDRRGVWRLKPQVEDMLTRDLTANVANTGWDRGIIRSASTEASSQTSTDLGATIGIDQRNSSRGPRGGKGVGSVRGLATTALAGANFRTTDGGSQSETASSNLSVNNFNVRGAVADAERAAARSLDPAATFTKVLGDRMFGEGGVRERYLDEAADRRSTADPTSPIASKEKASILSKGGFSFDTAGMPGDGTRTEKP